MVNKASILRLKISQMLITCGDIRYVGAGLKVI